MAQLQDNTSDPVLFEGMFIKSCIPVPNLPSDVDRSKYPYTSEFNYSICQ